MWCPSDAGDSTLVGDRRTSARTFPIYLLLQTVRGKLCYIQEREGRKTETLNLPLLRARGAIKKLARSDVSHGRVICSQKYPAGAEIVSHALTI